MLKHNIDQPSRQTIQKILVYGAGVLGSLYAGMLHQAGFEVTLLARGKRLMELSEQGLLLMIRAVKEGLGALHALDIPITPD